MTTPLVSVMVVLFVSVTMSDACSCIPVTSDDVFCRKDMIFRGTALSEFKEGETSTDPAQSWMLDQFAHWVYTIRVDQVFWTKEKSADLTTITVKTSVASNLCGTRLALDVPYVLFVYAGDGTFRTGLCDQNTPWDNIGAEDREYISTYIPEYCTNKTASTQP